MIKEAYSQGVHEALKRYKVSGVMPGAAAFAQHMPGASVPFARSAMTLSDHLAQGLSHEQAWSALERQLAQRHMTPRPSVRGMQAINPSPLQAVNTGGGLLHPSMFPGMSERQIAQIMAGHGYGG